jgi:hypothetical protein
VFDFIVACATSGTLVIWLKWKILSLKCMLHHLVMTKSSTKNYNLIIVSDLRHFIFANKLLRQYLLIHLFIRISFFILNDILVTKQTSFFNFFLDIWLMKKEKNLFVLWPKCHLKWKKKF